MYINNLIIEPDSSPPKQKPSQNNDLRSIIDNSPTKPAKDSSNPTNSKPNKPDQPDQSPSSKPVKPTEKEPEFDEALFNEYFASTPEPKQFEKPFLSLSEMELGKLRPGKKAISDDPKAVDVVYTYVDASDTYWKKARNDIMTSADFSKESQWRDTKELLFSLRSLLKHVSFIRHVYIVVSAPTQIPSWLDSNHPHVTIVYHTEIFPDRSYLPTFNSLSIEANIWRIPGLSDNFLYLNDDFFVGRDVPYRYFFDNAMGVVHVERYWFPKPDSTFYHNNIYEASTILKSHFGFGRETQAGTYRAIMHAPKLLNRIAANFTSSVFYDAYHISSMARFRQPKGTPYFVGMMSHSWVQESFRSPGFFSTSAKYHRCSPSEFRFEYMKNNPGELKLMGQRIGRIRPQFYCVNNDLESQTEEASKMFIDVMKGLYPDKSPWEKESV
ncbi:hypothetical protein GEMRC1_007471 [Eukaryota sp. GEM-RC1]